MGDSMQKTVVIGMSGGVDSSVAAYLLQKEGYQVRGVHMLTRPMDRQQEEAVHDARSVCERLGIQFDTVDFSGVFQQRVVDYFIHAYLRGGTPNPCVVCNRVVKWEALLSYADRIGAQYVATGHYAHVEQMENGRIALSVANGGVKDQTYALWNLTQEQLRRTLMPVGEHPKAEIRRIAEGISLEVAGKPDSQDICFIPDGDYVGFLRRSGAGDGKKGHFISRTGEVLGEHLGICHYTVGQRKGLGKSFGRPVYVCTVDPESGDVVLGDNEDLFHSRVAVRDPNWMGLDPEQVGETGLRCLGKIRYNQHAAPCSLFCSDGQLTAVFDQPQRAVTPGQSAVFYDGQGRVLAGGVIDRK